MHPGLITHIQKFVELSDTEIQIITSYFSQQRVKKKELLLEEEQICKKYYFILSGIFRYYIINRKGTEQTLSLAVENWWITDYLSFEQQKPAHFFIQAIENAEVAAIDKQGFDELLLKLPKLEHYFRIILQKSFGASQLRIRYLFTMSAEERYHHFNNSFPQYVQRIPQYILASYLDFSPEFMSKIRAGKI